MLVENDFGPAEAAGRSQTWPVEASDECSARPYLRFLAKLTRPPAAAIS